MAYFCDGPCGMRGEPRGKSGATPQGWVCVVVEGKMRHLCLAAALLAAWGDA